MEQFTNSTEDEKFEGYPRANELLQQVEDEQVAEHYVGVGARTEKPAAPTEVPETVEVPTEITPQMLEQYLDNVPRDSQSLDSMTRAFLNWRDKDPEEFGVKENLTETAVAAGGGVKSAIESILTVGKRYAGMIMQGNDYQPEFDPRKVDGNHPIAKTKWGPFVEDVAHFGTLAGGVMATGGVPTTALGTAVVSGTTVAISNKGQQNNAINTLQEIWPLTKEIPIFNSLDIEDTDHPLFKTAKNVLFEMGLGYVLDRAVMNLFGNSDEIIKYTTDVNMNVAQQVDEVAAIDFASPSTLSFEWPVMRSDIRVLDDPQLTPQTSRLPGQAALPGSTAPPALPGSPVRPALPEFSGYVNKPIANLEQGNAVPTAKPSKVLKQLNQIDKEGITAGSTDPIFTRAQVRRMNAQNGMSTADMKEIAQDLLSDETYQALVSEARDSRRSVQEILEPSLKRFQEIIGHDAMKESPEEYFKLILEDAPFQTGEGPGTVNLSAWSPSNVVVTDLVVSHLFKQAQNAAKAAREVMSYGDAFAIDGPMTNLKDNLVFALGQARRSRKLASYQLRNFRQREGLVNFKEIDPELIAKELDDTFAETKENIEFMFDVFKQFDTENPAFTKSILDMFASSESTRNWLDLDAYMRKKIRGGQLNGKANSGQLAREMQGVWINSALNSVKTPQRAFIGTAQFTFFRTLSRFFGSKMRALLPGGKKDTVNQLEAAAEMAAFFESLPDALNIAKIKLKNNFAKNNSNYNNRFDRYNKDEFNWEFADEYYSKRGSNADKAFYGLAKLGRNLNLNRVASWSNRVLGPIDDAWTYVMAKQRARSLAIRNAMKEVDNGTFTEITPEIMKRADELYFSNLLDDEGNIDIFKDPYLAKIVQENTLTTPLDGMPKAFQAFMNTHPLLARMFAFATPSINDLVLNLKNTPLLGLAFNEQRAILNATAKNFKEKVGKYGINTVEDLEAAKDDLLGRQAIGSAVLGLYSLSYMTGNSKGSGSIDKQQANVQRSAGRKSNTVSIGPVALPVSLLQTHHLMLKIVGLIGDNAHTMGEEWTQGMGNKMLTAIAKVLTDSSMMSQMHDLTKALNAEPGAGYGRLIGGQANTQIPFGGLRNDLGNVLNPYLKEIEADALSAIGNRNKYIPGLPDKFNILNGKRLNEEPPIVQFFNAISAVPINIGSNTKALELLERSNYDLRLSTYSAPGPENVNLQKHPKIRSEFAKAIGDWRNDIGSLEDNLDKMAREPHIIQSIKDMENKVNYFTKAQGAFGNRDAAMNVEMNPMMYAHNRQIKKLFDTARSQAWKTLEKRPDVQELIMKQREMRILELKTNKESTKAAYLDKLRNFNKP